MLVEKNNNDLTIRIPDGIMSADDIQYLLDFIRYREISKRSKATKRDLKNLLTVVKRQRKV